MTSVQAARAAFAESLRVSANLTNACLVGAFAEVPRERFLGPGPWTIYTESGPRQTPSDDPVHVYQNTSIALDAARMIYNGQPGLIAGWIEALALEPGARVVHIGCGSGYYSALLAHVVGPSGSVQAIDVDTDLIARARANLASWPWVAVEHGTGASGLASDADAVLVHAGATHILAPWLNAVRDGGRLLAPLTMSLPGMPDRIGKGVVLTATRLGDDWEARVGSFVAIYSLMGLRDAGMGTRLAEALRAGRWTTVRSVRTDRHEADDSCWLHHEDACVSSASLSSRRQSASDR